MVSLGDTAISLHILQLNSKCQDLPKFQFGCSVVVKLKVPRSGQLLIGGGGECSVVVKTQSAKICLNFNWGGGVL